MTRIKIKGQKLELRTRKAYERKDSYERYIESVKSFNKLVEKLDGKTIEVARINQAIEVYNYSHANSHGQPPAYWTANIDACYFYSLGELSLRANYRNIDIMSIL